MIAQSKILEDDIPVNQSLGRLRSIGMGSKNLPQHDSLTRASILVPLFQRPRDSSSNTLYCDTFMLFTLRPMKLRSHPGEVCFPGGKQDSEDGNDDVLTALREAEEEIGLDPKSVVPLCRLETIESYTGLCVTPVIGLIEPAYMAEPENLLLSEAEVEAAFVVPISYFTKEANLASKETIPWRGGMFDMRTYDFKSENGRTFKIWGLTAHIAYTVACIYSADEKHARNT